MGGKDDVGARSKPVDEVGRERRCSFFSLVVLVLCFCSHSFFAVPVPISLSSVSLPLSPTATQRPRKACVEVRLIMIERQMQALQHALELGKEGGELARTRANPEAEERAPAYRRRASPCLSRLPRRVVVHDGRAR